MAYEKQTWETGYGGNRSMYSGYSGNSMMAMKLRNLMNESSNDKERMMIQSWINEVEN